MLRIEFWVGAKGCGDRGGEGSLKVGGWGGLAS